MTRTLRIAAIKMNATPAPKLERLDRAAQLIVQAANEGAQLVVLPELFNTGYEYHENNYTLPETIDGDTVSWMKAQASEYNIHLSGSLLLLDGKDVYNSQILVAPDGRRWRYDKNYPYLFERAYYRDGSETMVADTELGKLGMMVCWDYAHPELWERYAGKVDAMVITSCPPKFARFELVMPNGHTVDSRAIGPVINKAYTGKDEPFGKDMNAQAAWLGVPLVNTTGGGTFSSPLLAPRIAGAVYLAFRPDLWWHIPNAHEIEMRAGYYNQTKITNVAGDVVSSVASDVDEGVTVTTVELPDTTPSKPTAAQPEIPYSNATYFFVDVFGPAIMERLYREGVRRQWGQKMAPFQRSVRWSIVIVLAIVGIIAGIVRGLGSLTARKKS